MGAPKGKPHRKFTQAEKLAYIYQSFKMRIFLNRSSQKSMDLI